MLLETMKKLAEACSSTCGKTWEQIASASKNIKETTTQQLIAAATKAEEHVCEAGAKVKETASVMKCVAGIQTKMLARRMEHAVEQSVASVKGFVQHRIDFVVCRVKALHQIWQDSHYFTLSVAPANGETVAETNVKKTHLKYAFTGIAAVFVAMSMTIGVLAHFAFQNEEQKQELLAYKQTKQEQEQTIKELRTQAEKNQKTLADISKLEDKVRTEMKKSGAELPPKADENSFAGQGGPSNVAVPEMKIVMEQESNIQKMASAKKANLESLLNVIEQENYRKEVTPSIWPTASGYVSSPFGGRRDPFGGYSRDWHPGIDIAADYGTAVYASATGYVEQAGWNGGYGRYIKIGHDFGIETAYAHMARLNVSAGQRVEKGQVIGYVGSSGYSTGPHLHFEVLVNGEPVNPQKYV